uniref:inorganic diphosphatase n=1 Tax=Grammatophora oceanica TaxID=210454 RepID=A0A7S1Y8S7_9STRA|mmetsp:Transcript_31740/g.47157  ORF Transcript_31740/g.47157 Transcript_31740/m.47157 type:complete len:326 (+) Transcript_31740:291-1268(+)|eukprot:CAMPEP_0194048330 /NCGR_PEP_ID=MMETSP0009_2-20130614/26926_1 /TAXON_ID=210454 /ORGANISM="Grammatophora oceanica, Strain CCMP 410" /LENGTH=325 /DNA_ID=CAMNT_0038694167 /DNA_START=256 /DNA_END=1233 /DNA_ORIENTATION=+
MEETFVPLKGLEPEEEVPVKTLSRSNSSVGSEKDLALSTSGNEDTLEYRIQGESNCGKTISLWHDVSLAHLDTETGEPTTNLNFVCEIPKFTRKKYEIATDEVGNPIKQDTKKGKLREFKKGDIFFNYGCFPQTWEDPTYIHPDAEGCRGDNDPLDVCEIGARIIEPGKIRPVKVLGILLMIDEGECDWKVVVIDAEDKWAPFLNDIDDVKEQLPGMLGAIREWYRTYKIPDGKPPNVFGLDEQFMDKAYAHGIIEECHVAWEELITGKKERDLQSQGEDVKALVRKLSMGSLAALGGDLDEHPEAHPEGFLGYDEAENEDALCF